MARPRKFAYVFLANGTMLNAEMLKNGKARVARRATFAHQQEFMRLEEEARAATEPASWARPI